jgi:hypothetical protein
MATTCKLIAKNVLGSNTASVTFSDIPQTGYTDLVMICSARSTRSATVDENFVRFNSDSGTTKYSNRNLFGSGSAAGSSSDYGRGSGYLYCGITVGDTATSNTFSSTEIYIPNYAGSTNKSVSSTSISETNATTAYITTQAGLWSDTAAITSILILPENGSWKSGSSFFLFGISKA